MNYIETSRHFLHSGYLIGQYYEEVVIPQKSAMSNVTLSWIWWHRYLKITSFISAHESNWVISQPLFSVSTNFVCSSSKFCSAFLIFTFTEPVQKEYMSWAVFSKSWRRKVESKRQSKLELIKSHCAETYCSVNSLYRVWLYTYMF